jgi:hypothetical protein
MWLGVIPPDKVGSKRLGRLKSIGWRKSLADLSG